MGRFLFILCSLLSGVSGISGDYNELILRKIGEMPSGGVFARYEKGLPEGQRFDALYNTVVDLATAVKPGFGGGLVVSPEKASRYSFCSSATYLLFCDVVSELQRQKVVSSSRELSRSLSAVGDKTEVIHGRMDGVGIFGHWNADGPGTAVLFQRLRLGRNFSSFEQARPGDFLKIFWNESIGKGESGHLVVFLEMSESHDAVKVWSSNLSNEDGSSGYGSMWVSRDRIERALFSRLESPANLVDWLSFTEAERTSEYLVRIRETGSTGEEMRAVTGAEN